MLDLIINRLTPSKLAEPAPSAAQLEQALLAAQAAPDHGRLKPWRFIVIEGDARIKFGQLMADALKARDASANAEMQEKEAQKPLRSPLTIVVVAEIQDSPKAPEVEQLLAAGAATQNLILALHAQGFGAQWKSGAASFCQHVKAGLGIKPSDHIVGIIYVGTPAEAGKPRPAAEGKVTYWK